MDTLFHLADSQPLAVFLAGAVLSLAASWLLVLRLEHLGERYGLTGALLGLVAAMAADMPEVTSAVTAVVHHEQRIGIGVIVGANLFQLAALLGLGSVVAGRIALHRKVVVLSGVVGASAAIACLAVTLGLMPAVAGLAIMLAILVPYVIVLGLQRRGIRHLPLPSRWRRWLATAAAEEGLEAGVAIDHRRGGPSDAVIALGALAVVVAASVLMERAASALGSRYTLPDIVVGGLGLAVVTSLPNAVAAISLAAHGKGTAVLSTALNSAAINVAAGLLVPAAIVGLGTPSGPARFLAGGYAALTVAALVFAYRYRGLSRGVGLVIIGAYLGLAALLLVTT